jgi:hypothetical protein
MYDSSSAKLGVINLTKKLEDRQQQSQSVAKQMEDLQEKLSVISLPHSSLLSELTTAERR